MKLVSAFLVASLAICSHHYATAQSPSSTPNPHSHYHKHPTPQQHHHNQHSHSNQNQNQHSNPNGPPAHPPPGQLAGRQGRGFPDIFGSIGGSIRNMFSRRPPGPGGPIPAPSKQYGVKPSATEQKPNSNGAGSGSGHGSQSPHSSGHQSSSSGFGPDGDGFRPSDFSNFGEAGGFGDYDTPYNNPPPHHGGPPKNHYGKPPKHAGPPPPSHHHGHGPPPPHGHGPSHGGPSHNHGAGGHGHGPFGSPQAAQQQSYNSFAEPQTQHHHYHAFQGQSQPQGQSHQGYPQEENSQYNEVTPSSYEPHQPGFHQPENQQPHQSFPQHGGQYEGHGHGPQTAQQFNRPSLSRPGPGHGGHGGPSHGGQSRPQFEGFGNGDFGSAPTSFGADFGPATPHHQPQAQGSQRQPIGGPGAGAASFFGGPDDYSEQYEEQTRNTREPEIITADNQYQFPGQGGQGGGQSGFSHGGQFDDYFSQNNQGQPQSTPSLSSSSSSSSHNNPSSQFGFENGHTQAPTSHHHQTGSPIIHKSHPLRSPHHHGNHGQRHSYNPYGGSSTQEESQSRRQPNFLFRPVSSSLRAGAPGAVDEDAVYGKPMMMSASSKKPLTKIIKYKPRERDGQRSESQHHNQKQLRPVTPPMPYKGPSSSSGEIVQLESPKDPNSRISSSASFHNPAIVEPDTAATGHHHHHGGLDETSNNGDRILYHVSGHQGPYSYRFGYDTGKGYNRQFRHEEKDGKGYVTGKYGFYDKHGKLNIVKYQAHPQKGYHAEREHHNVHQSHNIGHH